MGFVVVIVSLSPAADLRFSMDQFTRNPVFEIVSHYSGKHAIVQLHLAEYLVPRFHFIIFDEFNIMSNRPTNSTIH